MVGDIQPVFKDALMALPQTLVVIGDFLSSAGEAFVPDTIITNCPYSLAQEFVERCISMARDVALLMSLGLLGSSDRASWWGSVVPMPSLYVLPERPSYTGDGKSDSTVYAWYVWEMGLEPRAPMVLDTTPLEIRRRDEAELSLTLPPLRQLRLSL
jgi:hypothetical protein